jgi:hypothetical protein
VRPASSGDVYVNAAESVDDFFKSAHVDGNIMFCLNAKIFVEGQRQQAGASAGVIPILEAGLPIEVGLV